MATAAVFEVPWEVAENIAEAVIGNEELRRELRPASREPLRLARRFLLQVPTGRRSRSFECRRGRRTGRKITGARFLDRIRRTVTGPVAGAAALVAARRRGSTARLHSLSHPRSDEQPSDAYHFLTLFFIILYYFFPFSLFSFGGKEVGGRRWGKKLKYGPQGPLSFFGLKPATNWAA